MKHNYIGKYKNVKIRQLQINDLECLRQWRNNPKNTKYLRKIPYITTEMQYSWYLKYLDDESEMIFAIEEVNLGRTVGSMSLYNFDHDGAEFGKILIGDSEAHGKKVGVNAINAIMDIAKNQLSLKKLYLHVYKNNTGAVKVYEESGFTIADKRMVDEEIEYVMKVDLMRG